jgi:hypothetical protein
MSAGGPAPKSQRAGDRVTKGPLRPQSPEEDMSLSSWSLSPINGPVDPPEDSRKKRKGHGKIKAKGADTEERKPACHKKRKVAARMPTSNRVTKGPLHLHHSTLLGMYLSSWTDVPVDPPIDPPEDVGKMGKAADLVQARGADPPGRDGGRMLK